MGRLLALRAWVFLAAIAAWGTVPAGLTVRSVGLVLDNTTPATRVAATAGIVGLGGRVTHAFDGLLIAELQPGTEFRALRVPGIAELALNGIAPRMARSTTPAFALAAWNAIAGARDGLREPEIGNDRPAEMQEGDALVPPAVSLDAVRAASRSARRGVAAATTGGLPFGATELNTSEFLAGAVSINLIFVESDGTHEVSSENWTSDRESAVVAEVTAGLEWLRLQEPQAGLRFVHHVVSGRVSPAARTGYEPIRRAADPTGSTGEDLWTKEILSKMGYTTGDRFARSRALASDTRRVDGTDWAVNVFVADSFNDVDGKFADGRFAYTWIGGPHVVMTYDNQNWGVARFDMVLRHEMLHAFYAFDEYTQSACTCSEHRGYLDGANSNCDVCNAAGDDCVMIANGDALCVHTRRQIGWADLDGDGAIDVVGEKPDTFLDALPTQACAVPPVTGLATVVAATNRNPSNVTPRSSISVNRIAAVEVRADGQAWSPATPEDGLWSAAQERFHATLAALPAGLHRVEARAIDDRGNVDGAPVEADIVIAGGTSGLGDAVRAARGGSGNTVLSWDEIAGAAAYRVYRSGSAAGAFAPIVETPALTYTDATASSGFYQVRPVDGCGTERAD
jgi:hypothetical protein